jgi:hypothetical protein
MQMHRATIPEEEARVCTAWEEPLGQTEHYVLSNANGRELAAGSLEALRAAERLLGVELRYVWHYLPERLARPLSAVVDGFSFLVEER